MRLPQKRVCEVRPRIEPGEVRDGAILASLYALVWLLLACGLSMCSSGCAALAKLDPVAVQLAQATVLCVLNHSELPLPQIVALCAIEDAQVPAVENILAAHKAADAREHVAAEATAPRR